MDGLTQAQLQSPIWLLGDSYPAKWRQHLNGPLDPRHPTRHSIWTPVWDEIQRTVYNPDKLRVDDRRVCIANAAESSADGSPDWDFSKDSFKARVAAYGLLLNKYRPPIVCALGRRAYAFALLAKGIAQPCKPDAWSCKTLGDAFRSSIATFDAGEVNLFAFSMQQSHEGNGERHINTLPALRRAIISNSQAGSLVAC